MMFALPERVDVLILEQAGHKEAEETVYDQ